MWNCRAVGDQRDADQEQEAERQHLHRRVALDEGADRAAQKIIITITASTTAVDHDGDLLDHADGGDHRIEREDDVEQR